MIFIKYIRNSCSQLKDNTISFIFNVQNSESSSERGNLYLGSHYGVHQDYIKKYKIGSILTIMEHQEFYKHNLMNRIRILKQEGLIIHSKHITIKDPPILSWKETALFISDSLKNSNVFVHCVYGKSRSPSVIAAYLIAYKKMDPSKAIQLVQTQRNINLDSYWKQELDCFYNLIYSK